MKIKSIQDFKNDIEKRKRQYMRRPEVRSEDYSFHQGKAPACDSFRDKEYYLHFKDPQNNGKDLYFDPGCGKVYLCGECSELYTKQRTGKYINMTKALWQKFPGLQLGHIVLTFPNDYLKDDFSPWEYKRLFPKVRQWVKETYGDVGYLVALHNWSSSRPGKPHIHFHVIILGIDRNHQLINIFLPDLKAARARWGNILQIDQTPNIHLEYFTKYMKRDGKTISGIGPAFHIWKYAYRSPISDFVEYRKKNGLPIELTADYLKLAAPLSTFQRIRLFGWLSNGTKKKFLESIDLFETIKIETLIYIGFLISYYKSEKYIDCQYKSGSKKPIRINKADIADILKVSIPQYISNPP